MKKILVNLANHLLSKEQMKTVKGGDGYCQSSNFGNVNCRDSGSGSVVGTIWGCCTGSTSDSACKAAFGNNAYAGGC
ncbi:hypothetical protein GCM10023187_53070 [Nibrella viscosa]|uniref:Natural product n=1 Tax=Nibrella viscosa TaxID=1084524 RepID=A0ABP8KZ48_9BACT